MTFGEKLQALRKSRGWTQEQLSEQIHISRQTLSKWEQGSVLPDTEYVLSVSRLFQVSTDYLLRDEYDQPEQPLEKAPKGVRGDFSWLLWVLLGSLGAGTGLLGLVTLGILSAVFPAVYTVSPAGVEWVRVYTGLWGFLKTNHVEWLFYLCAGLTLLGIAAATHPLWKKPLKAFADQRRAKRRQKDMEI